MKKLRFDVIRQAVQAYLRWEQNPKQKAQESGSVMCHAAHLHSSDYTVCYQEAPWAVSCHRYAQAS